MALISGELSATAALVALESFWSSRPQAKDGNDLIPHPLNLPAGRQDGFFRFLRYRERSGIGGPGELVKVIHQTGFAQFPEKLGKRLVIFDLRAVAAALAGRASQEELMLYGRWCPYINC